MSASEGRGLTLEPDARACVCLCVGREVGEKDTERESETESERELMHAQRPTRQSCGPALHATWTFWPCGILTLLLKKASGFLKILNSQILFA